MSAKVHTVDEYLATVAPEMRGPLEKLRRQLMDLAPTATETISYAIPTLRYRDRVLVHYAAWRNHLALYGLDVAGNAELLAAYDTDKGTIRFSPDQPVAQDLLRTLIESRVAAIDASHEANRPRSRKAPPSQ